MRGWSIAQSAGTSGIDGDDVDVAQTRQLGIALADGELDEAQLAVFNLGQGVRS